MRKGTKHSEATKQKMRENNWSKRGFLNPRLGKHSTKESREKISKSHIGIQAGSKHPNWQGGIRKHHSGYFLIYSPNHPFHTKRGYILMHRFIMEKHLGRYLTRKEIVHHINGNTSDNRIENLGLFSNKSEHSKYHHPKGIKF